MAQRPNTRVKLGDITEAHCQAILDAYQGIGLHVNQAALNARHLALTLPGELVIYSSAEYRPDTRSQNKLDFEACSVDGQKYLHVQARPLDAHNGAELSDRFDKKMRELFM